MGDDDVVDITPRRGALPQTPQKRKTKTVPSFQQRLDSPHTPPPSEDNSAGVAYTGNRLHDLSDEGPYIDLEEVRQMIRREKARKLPGTTSSVLQERLIRTAIGSWDRCAQSYFDDVNEAVGESLTKLTHEYFSRFTESGLFNAVW